MIKRLLKDILFQIRRSFYQKYRINRDFSYQVLKNHKYDIFCGYYDITPFSESDRYLLYNKKINNYVEIICYDLVLEKEISFGKSFAWSTQMGARIFWLNKSKIVGFNVIEKKRQIFVLKDFKTNQIKKKIDYPIFDINRKNTMGLSLDFNQLEKVRPGYGFSGKNFFKDSIVTIDIKKNSYKKILSVTDIKDFLNLKKCEKPYFNHLSWSPCGRFFLFYFLWTTQNKKYNQVFFFNLKNKKISKISKNNEVISHFNWIDKNKLILTVKEDIFRYKIFNISNNSIQILNGFPTNLDGHPSVNPKNKKKIVTDTYPNYLGNQKLFIVNKNEKTLVGSFFLPKKYFGLNKSDLHPRWSNNGSCIAVDIAFSGKREIMVIK